MIDQLIASMLGTLAFVILFNAPRKEYFFSSANGALGWMLTCFFWNGAPGL